MENKIDLKYLEVSELDLNKCYIFKLKPEFVENNDKKTVGLAVQRLDNCLDRIGVKHIIIIKDIFDFSENIMPSKESVTETEDSNLDDRRLYLDMCKWLETNYNKGAPLKRSTSFNGSYEAWYFNIAKKNAMLNGTLPKKYYNLVNKYFEDRETTKPASREYRNTVSFEIPGSGGMGNPVAYETYYLDEPEMGG